MRTLLETGVGLIAIVTIIALLNQTPPVTVVAPRPVSDSEPCVIGKDEIHGCDFSPPKPGGVCLFEAGGVCLRYDAR